jgi:hypothetical protein
MCNKLQKQNKNNRGIWKQGRRRIYLGVVNLTIIKQTSNSEKQNARPSAK